MSEDEDLKGTHDVVQNKHMFSQLNEEMAGPTMGIVDVELGDKKREGMEDEETEERSTLFKILETISMATSSFFVTVATVLGTGILALPVKVADSGFGPFLITFLMCVVAQSLIIIYMVELLQKTQALQEKKEKNTNEKEKLAQLENEWNEEGDQVALTNSDTNKNKKKKKKKNIFLSKGPDLHTMGTFFLNPVFRVIFDFAVIIHFLAGPNAYAQLFGIRDYFPILISPFIIILAMIVIFGYRFIQQLISLATLVKGTLLIIMIILVGIVGMNVHRDWVDNYQFIGRPFLIGTVALGGAMNTLPVIYSKMTPSKLNIQVFRLGSVAGILVCALLNILWVIFILEIVPQTSDDPNAPSLSRAQRDGDISTVPVIEVINQSFPQYKWLGIVVQIFIMLSITVSFITISSGLKHMMDGYVKSFKLAASTEGTRTNKFVGKIARWIKHPGTILQFGLYIFCFGSILIVAQVNPKSFFHIMEIFTSAALNLESGFFVAYMIFTSRKYYADIKIPVPLPNFFIHTCWFVSAYFLFAVVYDMVYHSIALFIPLPF